MTSSDSEAKKEATKRNLKDLLSIHAGQTGADPIQ